MPEWTRSFISDMIVASVAADDDKAELYAGEVTKIQNHLASQGKRLMIWGDRLIDGKTTGIGAGSQHEQYLPCDRLDQRCFICDWHYERAEQTAVYFAMKGFDVATCPWRKPQIALQQVDDMIHFRQHSNPEMSRHFQGIIETVWSGADSFLEAYYNPTTYKQEVSDAVTVKKLIENIRPWRIGECNLGHNSCNPSTKFLRISSIFAVAIERNKQTKSRTY